VPPSQNNAGKMDYNKYAEPVFEKIDELVNKPSRNGSDDASAHSMDLLITIDS
jgi:hypothetical protein